MTPNVKLLRQFLSFYIAPQKIENVNITQSLKLQQRRKSNTNYRHPEGIIHKLQPTDQPTKQPERQPLSYAQHENLAIA